MAKIEEPKVTPERLMQFGFAYAPPLIIGAATANKVFDTLASGAKNVEEVSRKTGASIRGLRAIMNALVGLELLKKSGDKYALTPESEAFLVSNKPGTLAGFFSMNRLRLMQQWMKSFALGSRRKREIRRDPAQSFSPSWSRTSFR